MALIESHNEVIEQLTAAMDADNDNREQVRDCDHFLNKKDGQWEPYIFNQRQGRPRYTFDRTNPVIDQITGELRQADFTLRVSPAGGEATQKVAQVYDGLIRNIKNMSNADLIFDASAECMVGTGIGGWEIVQEYVNSDSFDQDLLVRPLMNFEDRVWFDPNYKMQDASDARFVYVLDVLTKAEYDKQFPDGSGMSVGCDRSDSAYFQRAESVTVGRLLIKREKKSTLFKMTNGAVYREGDEFDSVKDELEEAGITVEDTRSRSQTIVYSRMFDGGDWLTDEEETVFSELPIVQCVANFRISEGKVIYRGLTQFLMDQQRLINYYASKEAEDIALTPKPRYWATEKQIEGHQSKIRSMNIDNHPVNIYNPDDEAPGPPVWQGVSSLDPSLTQAKQAAEAGINQTAGLFGPNLGNNPGLQSGVALNSQITQGNISQAKYAASVEVALNYTGEILISAIPKVYDAKRTLRIIGDDGSSEIVTINDVIIDNETGEPVEVNNLSKGQYDVVASIGSSFKNRQDEANSAISELVAANPQIAGVVQDLWAKNIQGPEMDKIAERLRGMALSQGLIPQEQLSDDELAAMQQQQANAQQQPDPAMVIAQAEMIKGQAEMQNAQNKANELQIKFTEMQNRALLENNKLQSQAELNQAKVIQTQQGIEQDQQKIDMQAQSQQFSQFMQQASLVMEQMQSASQRVNMEADTLKKLREASGVDTIIGAGNVEAYARQTEEVKEAQDDT